MDYGELLRVYIAHSWKNNHFREVVMWGRQEGEGYEGRQERGGMSTPPPLHLLDDGMYGMVH